MLNIIFNQIFFFSVDKKNSNSKKNVPKIYIYMYSIYINVQTWREEKEANNIYI